MFRPSQPRSAWRMLRKSPATSALAVVALALGIGLTTTMFSLLHGVLMSRVPFADPARMVALTTYNQEEGGPRDRGGPPVPVHDFLDWKAQQTTFEDLAASTLRSVNLNDEAGYPERYQAGLLTWNTLRVLGIEPMLGRDFNAEDDVSGAARVALLGHDMFRHRFSSDPSVVGRTIRIDGEPTTVVGVMPAGFEFPLFEDLWLPLRLDVSELERGQAALVWVVGRLRDGVRVSDAQAEISTISARLAEAYPETNAGRAVLVRNYRRSLNSAANTAIMGVMFGAVCLVLVIACANVASLLLARASMRAKELAIRTALGARRFRVMGLLITESVLLSLCGSVFGLGLARVGTAWMASAFQDQTLPYWISFEMQPQAFVFVTAVGLAAGVVSGLLPALRATAGVTFDLLKDESRGSSGLRIGKISRVLVTAELALACALLVATGLLVRTVVNYGEEDLGFDTESILIGGLTLPESDYADPAEAVAFFERLVDDLESLPQVVSAAAMSGAPGTFMGRSPYGPEGESYANRNEIPSAPRGVVSPGFFETYGIPVLEGRVFHRQDTADSPLVVVVNESFVAETWPGESAIGKRIRLGGGEETPWRTVVGVVPDAGISLLNPSFVGTTNAGFYVPHTQHSRRSMDVAVKTRGEASTFAATLLDRVRRMDAGLPVDDVRTQEKAVSDETLSTKVIAVSFSFFGFTALVLASVGIFGVMMFSVHQRTREIGLRMALGARPAEVLGLVLRQGIGRIVLGLVSGLGLAYGLASSLEIVLFEVEPSDPVSFLGTAAVLSAVALLACTVPAWRAARVDPLVALRYE